MYSKVHPVWSPELAQLSGLQHHHFLNIEQKIMDAFEIATRPPADHLAESNGSRAETGNTMRSEQDQSEVFSPGDMAKMLNNKAVFSD